MVGYRLDIIEIKRSGKKSALCTSWCVACVFCLRSHISRLDDMELYISWCVIFFFNSMIQEEEVDDHGWPIPDELFAWMSKLLRHHGITRLKIQNVIVKRMIT